MKFKTIKYFSFVAIISGTAMVSCVSDPNSPGVEYMPDMYRSPAVEAYVDYAEVRGVFREDLVGDEVSFLYDSPEIFRIVFNSEIANTGKYLAYNK